MARDEARVVKGNYVCMWCYMHSYLPELEKRDPDAFAEALEDLDDADQKTVIEWMS